MGLSGTKALYISYPGSTFRGQETCTWWMVHLGFPFHIYNLLLSVLGDAYWYVVGCQNVRSVDLEVKDFVGGLSVIIVINIVS